MFHRIVKIVNPSYKDDPLPVFAFYKCNDRQCFICDDKENLMHMFAVTPRSETEVVDYYTGEIFQVYQDN